MWQVSDDRVHRWRARRRELGTLEDLAPGGTPVHALLAWEVAEILAIVEEWGPVDRSHRRLAHRGSCEGRVWVAPSTVRRVLAGHGLVLPERPPMPKRAETPWPDWLVWDPNHVWIWDLTHFTRARRAVFAIVDMVSRYWITTLVSPEETSTQVRAVFDQALLELQRVRIDYNTVRPHEAVGYVTPDDEHHGRGEAIREARRHGLQRARDQRLDHNRRTTTNNPEETA